MDFSLDVESKSYSLAVVHSLLTAAASLVAERGLYDKQIFVALQFPGSGAQAQEPWHTGLVALQPVGSFQIRNWTCVSYLGSQILYHPATREAQKPGFLLELIYLRLIWEEFTFLWF